MRIHREKDTATNQDKHTQKNTHTHWGLHAAVDDLFLDPLLSKIPNTALSVSLSLSISLSLSLTHSLSLVLGVQRGDHLLLYVFFLNLGLHVAVDDFV